jgi:hypothetical protein
MLSFLGAMDASSDMYPRGYLLLSEKSPAIALFIPEVGHEIGSSTPGCKFERVTDTFDAALNCL